MQSLTIANPTTCSLLAKQIGGKASAAVVFKLPPHLFNPLLSLTWYINQFKVRKATITVGIDLSTHAQVMELVLPLMYHTLKSNFHTNHSTSLCLCYIETRRSIDELNFVQQKAKCEK